MTDPSPRQLLEAGDLAGAKSAAQQRLSSKKNDPEALATLAKLALEAGDVDAAERFVAQALPKDRGDYDLGLVEAMLLAQHGNGDGARVKYAELIGKAPNRGEAHFGLGFLLLSKDLVKDARGPLTKAATVAPRSWAKHF
jgi:Flp pilus assembly protein TadD